MTEVVQGECAFRIPAMYHPSLDVLDLDEAEAWYARVFGRPSVSLKSIIGALPPRPGSGYPPDYSTFTLLADVLMDTIDPRRYVIGGVQRLPSVAKPHLRLISWYSDDMSAAARELRRHGIRITNQLDEVVEDDEAPTAFGSDMPLFYTLPQDVGLRYSFSPPPFVKATDPRSNPGWTLQEDAADDPLGLRCCSHHTLLTDQPQRALKLLRDALGGEVFHRGRNELLGADCVYVHLGGSTVELATPDAGAPAYADWQERAPDDTYHAISWRVADLARAERHLEAQGVKIASRSAAGFLTDPRTSLGVPWGFFSALIPGDPRQR